MRFETKNLGVRYRIFFNRIEAVKAIDEAGCRLLASRNGINVPDSAKFIQGFKDGQLSGCTLEWYSN